MRIEPTPFFVRMLKRLAKKYPSITADVRALAQSLEENPTQGTALRHGAYKIRLAIRSKNKGKSSGSRVITCVRVQHDVVYLLDIYDKSDRENISDKELDTLIDQIDELED